MRSYVKHWKREREKERIIRRKVQCNLHLYYILYILHHHNHHPLLLFLIDSFYASPSTFIVVWRTACIASLAYSSGCIPSFYNWVRINRIQKEYNIRQINIECCCEQASRGLWNKSYKNKNWISLFFAVFWWHRRKRIYRRAKQRAQQTHEWLISNHISQPS